MFAKTIACVLLALLLGLPGCVAMQAMDAATKTVHDVALVLAEKSNITETSAEAGASVEDPAWVIEGYWVQGVRVESRLRGVKASGKIRGSGSGPDKPLSPETLAELRRRGFTAEQILEMLAALNQPAPTTQPAGGT